MKDKILVVDDMEMNREILRGIFEDDYEVILAENGREAVEYINLNRGKLASILPRKRWNVSAGNRWIWQYWM